MRVFIFGDSVAQGFYDDEGGWVQRLTNLYHPKSLSNMNEGIDSSVEVFNLGVSGDTAEGICSRMMNEMQSRQLYEDEEAIVIAIGLNDSVLLDNRAVTDMEDFQKSIEKIIKNAQKISNRILLVGLTPVVEDLTDPWKFSTTGKQWKNNRIDLFEDTIKQSALRNDVKFVPLYDKLTELMEEGVEVHADGLHPNNEGHQFIADLVKPHLEGLLQ